MATYTFETSIDEPMDRVRARAEAALKAEGFGVLTEIDVSATLKAKLGLDRPPFVILGACNPALASRALDAEPSIGALLPCNVVLREGAAGPSQTIVEILDPTAALGIAGDAVEPVALEATERLRRVIDAIANG